MALVSECRFCRNNISVFFLSARNWGLELLQSGIKMSGNMMIDFFLFIRMAEHFPLAFEYSRKYNLLFNTEMDLIKFIAKSAHCSCINFLHHSLHYCQSTMVCLNLLTINTKIIHRNIFRSQVPNFYQHIWII